MTRQICEEIKEAVRVIEKSNKHFFVTGKAGTGKSTLVEHLRNKSTKNIVVLAPTGVAAVNVDGQTIHSFFGFKPGIAPENVKKTYRNRKLYKNLDTLIIDEISMVRADLLDCISVFLKMNGPKEDVPFGGVQVVMVGDLYQLPPVLSRSEKDFYGLRYKTPYFFSANQFKKIDPEVIKLRTVHRQKNGDFLKILNKIRKGRVEKRDLEKINENVKEFNLEEDGIFLTTTNRKVDKINSEELRKLKGKEYQFGGKVEGSFPKSYLPTAKELKLKIGAKVMLLNNDKDGRWINGDIGEILEIDSNEPLLRVKLENGRIVKVSNYKWKRLKYKYNSKTEEVKSDEVGSFNQLPIRLAWATTIHKAQGKTFDRAMIDFQNGTFSHGQAYVALSRCTSLEGLSLLRPIKKSDIIVDQRVNKFLNSF